MTSESEIIIAFVFNRSGKNKLTPSDFYLTLSMDLNWFSPKQAKLFLNKNIEQNLLKEENGAIIPNFEIKNIEVPIGFYPSKKAFEEKTTKKSKETEYILDIIINEIVKNSNLKKENIKTKISNIVKEKNITPEIAALIIGKDFDISFDKYYEKIEATLGEK